MRSRREMKRSARRVVKSHYGILVLICVISMYVGTENASVVSHANNLYAFVTSQEIGLPMISFKNPNDVRDKVLSDIINDDLPAGEQTADDAIKGYKDEPADGAVLGRQKGILASAVNNFTSGHLYVTIAVAIGSIVKSGQAVSIIMIILAILIYTAVWIFVLNLYQAIMRRLFLEARVYDKVPLSHMLHVRNVRCWLKSSLTLAQQALYLFLWSLTAVGGFIKYYSYFLVPYIVAESPDIQFGKAITLSRQMMNGHKWECFKLEMTLIGWSLLGWFTFGLSEIFWSIPYRTAVFSEYYVDIRSEAKEKGLLGAKRLNDTYLYEKAEDKLLSYSYADVEEQGEYIATNKVTLTRKQVFCVKNFGLWIGSERERRKFDNVQRRAFSIRAAKLALDKCVYPDRLNPLWTKGSSDVARRTNFLKSYSVITVILTFFAFSMIGWLWEVGIHLVLDGVFVNRGALHGPWLPIYGAGITLILLLLAKFRNRPLLEVILMIIVCGIVEYSTSYYLEVTKGLRWWDYTGYFLNLNGRICGEGLMVFAFGGIVAIYLFVPILDEWFSKINVKVAVPICVLLVALFSADLVYSHYVPNEGKGITNYDEYKKVERKA